MEKRILIISGKIKKTKTQKFEDEVKEFIKRKNLGIFLKFIHLKCTNLAKEDLIFILKDSNPDVVILYNCHETYPARISNIFTVILRKEIQIVQTKTMVDCLSEIKKVAA